MMEIRDSHHDTPLHIAVRATASQVLYLVSDWLIPRLTD